MTVTGLTADTAYHFRAYAFDDTISPKYNTDTATYNPNNRNTLPYALPPRPRPFTFGNGIYGQLERL